MAEITLDEIETTVKAALVAHGAQDWIAAHVADAVRVAESYGNKICGLYYVESYCQQLASGRVKGDAEPVVSLPRPALVQVDAKFGNSFPHNKDRRFCCHRIPPHALRPQHAPRSSLVPRARPKRLSQWFQSRPA